MQKSFSCRVFGEVNYDDHSIIKSTLAGNTAAFNILITRYQSRIYNAVYRVCYHHDEAADITQEAFLQAYLSLRNFQGNSAFYTWLFRIAFNIALSLKRRRSIASLEEHQQRNLGYEPIDTRIEPNPAWQIEQEENAKLINWALLQLSEDFRVVMILKEIEGMKYEEISEILNIPIGTVRSRLHRARWDLKQILEAKLGTQAELEASQSTKK